MENGVWVEVEATEVEEDGVSETSSAAEASGGALEALDHGVEVFEPSVGDGGDHGAEDSLEGVFDHACDESAELPEEAPADFSWCFDKISLRGSGEPDRPSHPASGQTRSSTSSQGDPSSGLRSRSANLSSRRSRCQAWSAAGSVSRLFHRTSTSSCRSSGDSARAER